MTLRRGLLLTCAATTLFAQEHPAIDQAALQGAMDRVRQVEDQIRMQVDRDRIRIGTGVHKALEMQQEILASRDGLEHAHVAIAHAREAMAANIAINMHGPLFQVGNGRPPATADEEMKMMAIDSIMQNDVERAVPLVEKVLLNPQSAMRVRMRALQALAHSSAPRAREIVIRVAKDGSNTELQSRAIQLLGERENSQNKQLLSEIYSASANADIKRQVIRSLGSAGAKDQILSIAKSDPNPEMRTQAIRHLSGMRANADLAALYASETSTEVRGQLLRAIGGSEDWQKLVEIAKTEKNEELRNRAIQQVGSIRATGAADALVAMYGATSDASARGAILRSLSQERNAKQLIAVARQETDPELKRTALQHLTRMKGEEVTTYLTELLAK